MTIVEKVNARILAPSTQLNAREVVDVLNFIFEWNQINMAGIWEKLNTMKTPIEERMPQPQEPQEPPMPPYLNMYTQIFKRQRANIIDIGVYEASGYGLLSEYLLLISERLKELYEITSKVDLEFQIKGQGKTFMADGCIVAVLISVDSYCRVPVYILEYKPRVPRDIDDIEPHHLSELFLQSYYLHKDSRCHSTLHVLTDLTDFHYFEIKQCKIVKHHSTRCSLVEPIELFAHINLVCAILKEIISNLLVVSSFSLS